MIRVVTWLITATLGVFLLHAASYPLGWGDVYWQIATGRLIWQVQGVPHVDPFAWTSAGRDWVEHEWLTDLLYFGLYQTGGFLAIRLFFTAMWLTGIAQLQRLLTRAGSSPLATLTMLVATVGLCSRQFIPAPSTISLFFALSLVSILKPWQPKLKATQIIAATLVFYVWCNMHSVAMLALGVLALWVAVGLFQSQLPKSRVVLFAACVAVSFLTPYGIKIHHYALAGPKIAQAIDEWQPLLASAYVGALEKTLFVGIVILFVVSVAARIRQGSFAAWQKSPRLFADLAAVACIALAFKHARFIWLGAVPLAIATRAFANELSQVRVPSWQRAGGTALLLAAILINFGWTPDKATQLLQPSYYRVHIRPGAVPEGAADYLLTHRLEGRMFNHYIWGGYLLFRLFPEYRVFIDGRTVLHGADLVQDELHISHGAPDAPALLDRYGIRTMVVEPGYMTPEVAATRGWQVMYRDRSAMVLHR